MQCSDTIHDESVSFPLLQGEKSFFLQPGEQLENGIQDVYVLSEEEGLVLKAVEAFVDTEVVRDRKGKGEVVWKEWRNEKLWVDGEVETAK